MKKEIEAKFLQISIDEIREKLIKLNAALQTPMRLMRRVMIKTPEMYKNDSFLRVRDEGNKITITYKQFEKQSVDGCNEIEVNISHFDDMIALLKHIGLSFITYQESKRECWTLDNVEIVIDEWPWVKPYIELESETEEELRCVAQKLNLNWDDAVFGSVMRAYEAEYPIMKEQNILISDIPEVKFNQKIPELLINGNL